MREHARNTGHYAQTRDALTFLYEEAIRHKSFDMAEILLQALGCCERLIDADYNPSVSSRDAVTCAEFVQGFIGLKPERKKEVFHLLASFDQGED